MKKLAILLLFTGGLFVYACGGEAGDASGEKSSKSSAEKEEVAEPQGDPKGVGEVRNVNLSDTLNVDMVVRGKQIYDMKCASCHKLTDKRVVGPGFQGVTNRRRPEWIMNMITNVETMLAEDPVAQKLLEECLTRMPNQGLSIGDARDVLEFLRQNDEARAGERDQGLEEG